MIVERNQEASHMNIVLEGVDNSGKSTLAQHIRMFLANRFIVASEGPEKYKGEIDARIEHYNRTYHEVIYDRHPCVSQVIYSSVHDTSKVRPDLIDLFYASRPLMIYCRSTRGLAEHVMKEHDDAAAIERVKANYDSIVRAYDAWALQHTSIIYRIGDLHRPILMYIREQLYARQA